MIVQNELPPAWNFTYSTSKNWGKNTEKKAKF